MRTWKIIVLAAILTAALIATVARQASDGFARGGVADQATDSRQQTQRMLPVAAPRKPDTDKTPDAEPWGPFRTTDW
jgi:hypothetical protein